MRYFPRKTRYFRPHQIPPNPTRPKTSVMSRAESLAMAGLVVGTVAPTKPMLAWLSGFGLLVLS